MPFNVGPIELIIVLVIALLVVGPRRLPEMGNAVGKTIREFRKASTDVTDAATLEPDAKPDPASIAVPPPNTVSGQAAPSDASEPSATNAAADDKTDDKA